GPGGGKGGKGGKGGNGQGAGTAPAEWYFVQQNQQPGQGRGGRGQPQTPEERAAQVQMRLERAREERAKLAEILLPHQIKRLNEIYIQQAGAFYRRHQPGRLAKSLRFAGLWHSGFGFC